MKKVFAILLSLTMTAALLAGCGSTETTPAASDNNPASQEPAQQETQLSGSVSTNL